MLLICCLYVEITSNSVGSSVSAFLGVISRKRRHLAWAEDCTKMWCFTVCVVSLAFSHAKVGKPFAISFIISGGPRMFTSSAIANNTPLPSSILNCFV